MASKKEPMEKGTDIAGEYFRRYLILGSRLPFIKIPLFFVGCLALAGKGVETLIKRQEEKEHMATVVTTEVNPWTMSE